MRRCLHPSVAQQGKLRKGPRAVSPDVGERHGRDPKLRRARWSVCEWSWANGHVRPRHACMQADVIPSFLVGGHVVPCHLILT